MTQPLTDADRVAGGLIGLLVGDALGVPYEFKPPERLPPTEQIEFHPPAGFQRSHEGVLPGTWSDDGAQALVLLDSLLACDGLDLAHFGAGIQRWLHEGFYAVNRSVFDIGVQTSAAINRLASGTPADRSGPSAEKDNGNGSLMRVLPLALWHQGSASELIALAARQSLPTHGHVRAQVVCSFYCLWARQVLDGAPDAWQRAELQLREHTPEGLLPESELELVLENSNSTRVRGSGYVLDTLWSARHAVESTDSYEGCVRRAIAFGHDTDTTAAVAGGIAGIKYGLVDIPERWQVALRGQELYRSLLEALLRRRR